MIEPQMHRYNDEGFRRVKKSHRCTDVLMKDLRGKNATDAQIY